MAQLKRDCLGIAKNMNSVSGFEQVAENVRMKGEDAHPVGALYARGNRGFQGFSLTLPLLQKMGSVLFGTVLWKQTNAPPQEATTSPSSLNNGKNFIFMRSG